jgi:N-acetyl-anhydromuramyl-L-alanine amidase AmpD
MNKIYNVGISGVNQHSDGTYDIATEIDVIYAEDEYAALKAIKTQFEKRYPDIQVDNIIVDEVKIDVKVDLTVGVGENLTTQTTIRSEKHI